MCWWSPRAKDIFVHERRTFFYQNRYCINPFSAIWSLFPLPGCCLLFIAAVSLFTAVGRLLLPSSSYRLTTVARWWCGTTLVLYSWSQLYQTILYCWWCSGCPRVNVSGILNRAQKSNLWMNATCSVSTWFWISHCIWQSSLHLCSRQNLAQKKTPPSLHPCPYPHWPASS